MHEHSNTAATIGIVLAIFVNAASADTAMKTGRFTLLNSEETLGQSFISNVMCEDASHCIAQLSIGNDKAVIPICNPTGKLNDVGASGLRHDG